MTNTRSLADILNDRAAKAEQGPWIPGTGEEPIVTRNRRRLLYCWQPSTGRKAYLDLDTDLLLSNEEAWAALGL